MAASRGQRLVIPRNKRVDATSSSKQETLAEISDYGLKVLSEGYESVVDIVAVHGLHGHRDKTWTAANDVHWLRDFLSKDLPKARIFTWGYAANLNGDISCQSMYDHARSLVSDLCLERTLTETTQRPIIFVAHCLGGLIVKMALIHSDSARKGALEEHRSIKTSTYGIIFMGTPHQGTNGVKLGSLLSNLASVYSADDHLLKHLERDSEWMQQQLAQYNSISGDFRTKFCYEEYETATAAGLSILVVPRASAVVPGATDVEPIVIHADHINMVKFRFPEDQGYKTVSGHLKLMAKRALDDVALRWVVENKLDAGRIDLNENFSIAFNLPAAYEISHFVSRNKELDEMHKILSHDTNRRAVTLYGLGGIGKTQLAIAYAKMHRKNYSATFWLNIKDEGSVKKSFAQIARQISKEHASSFGSWDVIHDNDKLAQAIAAVKNWLENVKNTGWLMIFDNYDSPKLSNTDDSDTVDIGKFFPNVYHGSIIITTRSPGVNVGQRMRVGKFEEQLSSLQILSDSSGRDGVLDDPAAAELAKELDGLPLALATAGAYLHEVPSTFEDYLQLYRTSWLKLQKSSPEVSSYEDRQLYSTWQMSLDNIKKQNMNSARLLQLWAYLDNQDLWFDLLRAGRSGGPEWLSQITEDEINFNEAVRVLCNHGLVEVGRASHGSTMQLNLHSCVHAWTIHVVNQEWDFEFPTAARRCVAMYDSGDNAQYGWKSQRRLLQHADRCIINREFDDHGEPAILAYLGYLYDEQDRDNDAIQMYQRALERLEKEGKLEGKLAIHITFLLGVLYTDLGRYVDAGKMLHQALQRSEKKKGPEHKETLRTMTHLGLLHQKLHEYEEAEKWHQRTLQSAEKVLGRRHELTLKVVQFLGRLYQKMGRFKEAEALLKRALEGLEIEAGFDHAMTLDSAAHLGILYTETREYSKAEELFLRALQGYEKYFAGHSQAVRIADNMGALYYDLKRYEEAEMYFERAMKGFQVELGSEHKSTLTASKNLARARRARRKPE